MNKEDIKKALKMCADLEYCDYCPYFNWENRSCSDKLQRDALDLITEQEKEIERLKADNAELEENLDMLIKEQKGDYDFEIKQAKIDVLNELKAKSYVNDYCREVVEVEKIDELLKEYKE